MKFKRESAYPAGEVSVVGRLRQAEAPDSRTAPAGQVYAIDPATVAEVAGARDAGLFDGYLLATAEDGAAPAGLQAFPRPETTPGSHLSYIGVVISDIHRHWIPWLAVYAATRIVSRDAYVRHDGPLSVAKGFRAADWEDLKETEALSGLTYSWRPLFRYVVIIEKGARENVARTRSEAIRDDVHGTDV